MATDVKKSTDDAKAEAVEEDAKPTVFEYDGNEYTIDADAANDLELYEALEDDKYLTAIRGFLGKPQWTVFKDRYRNDRGRVPMGPVEDFLSELMEAIGEGNS